MVLARSSDTCGLKQNTRLMLLPEHVLDASLIISDAIDRCVSTDAGSAVFSTSVGLFHAENIFAEHIIRNDLQLWRFK